MGKIENKKIVVSNMDELMEAVQTGINSALTKAHAHLNAIVMKKLIQFQPSGCSVGFKFIGTPDGVNIVFCTEKEAVDQDLEKLLRELTKEQKGEVEAKKNDLN